MADEATNGAEAPAESPQSRLIGAGFGRQLEWWTTPDDERVVTMEEAIRLLDSGEIAPAGVPFPDMGVRALPDELVDRICPPPQPSDEPPAWLLAQAEVIAQATVEKLKPIIRAEIRAELRKGRNS